LVPQSLLAQDDAPDVPSQDLKVGENEQQRYFLIGPLAGAKAPAEGWGLMLVLPGGDGGADFHPFVKRICQYALPEGFVAAQLVAPKWEANPQIVWPTAKSRVTRAKFTTEAFVDAVIKDVAARHKLNDARIMTLSWSSGGPAAYAVSLTNPKVRASLVAMSVFNAAQLPPLEKAKGHAYYLYHSPTDPVCPYRMAQQAAKALEEKGATVKLTTYEGGHGWRGNVFGDIRTGVTWLEENTAK
jgi:predicted esterase